MTALHLQQTALLRAAEPGLPELVERARWTDPELWERRPVHADHLCLALGLADRNWVPPTCDDGYGGQPRLPHETRVVLDRLGPLPDVPFTLGLGKGEIVALVGPRDRRERVARALLVRSVVLHGPADLRVVVGRGNQASWSWTDRLPHHSSRADLVAGPSERTHQAIGSVATSSTRWLLAVDADDLQADAPLRRAVNDRSDVAAIVLCESVGDAPSETSMVVELRDSDTARVSRPRTRELVDDILVATCSTDRAIEVADHLNDVVDLDLEVTDTARLDAPVRFDELQDWVELPDGVERTSRLADQIEAAWGSPPAGIGAAIGRTGGGHPLVLDLEGQGPHALVGGTTGSGKSELLRTFVVGLAVRCSPERVNFLLFDFKGGSAFDACTALPHVVGVVTDLDRGLAERALSSLDAEVRHRERALRHAGAADLDQLRGRAGGQAIPSLIVIVDEFATLSAEAPDFVDRLVGIAQRGRSLGIHLVLATQRPSGVVSEPIRANTDVRIALRMADPHDSTDVIGGPDAAGLDRGHPGQAYVRLGPGEVIAARFAHLPPADLADLVAAVESAWGRTGGRAPRSVWLPPLPDLVSLDSLSLDAPAPKPAFESESELEARPASESADDGPSTRPLLLGLLDIPSEQVQHPWSWTPSNGTLLVVGMPGSGTTSALRTTALAFVTAHPDGQIYAIDHDGSLADLDGLPRCGGVLPPDDVTRQRRLARHLMAEIVTRRTSPSAARPPVLVAIDDLPGVLSRHDDLEGLRFCDAIGRIHADGPALGVHLALASSRAGGLPSTIVSTTRDRIVLTLPDRFDYATFGLAGAASSAAGTPPAGRGWTADGTVVQLAVTAPELLPTLAMRPHDGDLPVAIESLPGLVTCHDLGPVPALADDGPWYLPIALGDSHLAPCGLVLHPGDHAVVAGPARSGRSATLDTIAWAAESAGIAVVRSDGRTLDPVALVADLLVRADSPLLVIVDDADRVTDADRVLEAVVRDSRPGHHIVVAGRPDRLRAHYRDWISAIRESAIGLALRPDLDVDGDLFGVRFPRRTEAAAGPGRGYLVVDGVCELVQVAAP